MKTLDVLINEAAASGLKALTLFRIPDGTWQANASQDRTSWRVEFDANASEAIAKVLGSRGPTHASVGLAPVPATVEEDIFD